jgi:hypothetical protein
VADIDRVYERVAHEAADQADHAVGGEHAGGGEGVAAGLGTLDIVHGLDEVVDAERDRRDQDDAQELEAREDVVHGRQRHPEAEARDRLAHLGEAHAAQIESDRGRGPGDQHASRDGDEAGRDAARVAQAPEPGDQDHGEAHDPDHGCGEHLEGRPHRDEGDRHAGQRAQEGGAGRDPADEGGDEAAQHQDEALHEHPGEAGFPALDRIAG